MPPADWPTWTLWVAGAGALSTALLAIVALLAKTGRGVKTAGAWVRGVVVDAITEVVREHSLSAEQITEIVEAKVAPIHAELTTNGGKSLKDQVTRMDERDIVLEQLLHDHMRDSSLDRADLRHWLERIDPGRIADRPGGPPDGGPSY